ncbi:hypothetical protein ACKKBG_A26770 [Auxenochlorella protothecoides x Auxenochlorella symbiontica]
MDADPDAATSLMKAVQARRSDFAVVERDNEGLIELVELNDNHQRVLRDCAHGRPVWIGSTHGTNDVNIKAFLLIAMDSGNRVHNGSAALRRHEGVEGIQKWLRVIFNKMGQDWMLSCVFIDASAAEYSAIRSAFPYWMPVHICSLHQSKAVASNASRLGKGHGQHFVLAFKELQAMSFGLRKDSSQAAKDVALETAKARVEAVLTDASVPPGLADHFRGQWVDKFPLCK